jgi:hypothetical protein
MNSVHSIDTHSGGDSFFKNLKILPGKNVQKNRYIKYPERLDISEK